MTVFDILVATDLTDDALALLQNADDVRVRMIAPSPAAVRDGLRASGSDEGAHAIIARDDVRLDAELIVSAPRLKVIARPSAGLSGIDIDAATRRGVSVMNAPGVSAIAAAEYAFTLMLALSRRLVEAHAGMRAGYWLLDRRRQVGAQLTGKTLGVVGLGRTGRIVAQRALAFNMTVLANDPYISEEQARDERVQLVGLRELLSRSDFVTLHVPATAETRHIIDAQRIRQMKRGARLVNTAHGYAIDEQAVVDALKDGHLAGVAVDVYPEEPPYNSPLVGLDGVIHTPHISDNTVEAAQDLSLQIVQQLLDALRGTDYRNIVNMPFMPGINYEDIQPYLQLAERIGTLLHVLARSPIKRMAVEFRGDEVSGLVKPLTVAALKGMLTPVLGEAVSYINAPVLTGERGIQVTQVKGLKTGDYTNQVSFQVTLEDGEEIVMSGTLLDHRDPHIVQINEYRMNFVPQGHLVLMGSHDQPGVIGRVGTLLASSSVNIASWHTGRAYPGGNTLTVLTLDEALPDPVLEELRGQEFIRHAHRVYLP